MGWNGAQLEGEPQTTCFPGLVAQEITPGMTVCALWEQNKLIQTGGSGTKLKPRGHWGRKSPA